MLVILIKFFFFQAVDGIRDDLVTGVQTCALPIYFNKLKSMFSLSVGAKAVSNNLRQTLSSIMATVHAHLCVSFEYTKHIRSMQSAYI